MALFQSSDCSEYSWAVQAWNGIPFPDGRAPEFLRIKQLRVNFRQENSCAWKNYFSNKANARNAIKFESLST